MKKISMILLTLAVALTARSGNVDTVLVHSDVMNKDIKTVVITPTQTRKNRDAQIGRASCRERV